MARGQQPPAGFGSLMSGAAASSGGSSAASGEFTDDVYFDPDDTYYLGVDSDTMANGRPREIRFTRLLTSEYDHGVGETPAETNGIVLRNSSAAAVGLDQFSPSLFMSGYSWETTGGSSQVVTFREEVQTVQGAAASGNWTWSADINEAGYTKLMSLTSGGALQMEKATGANILWGTDGGGSIGAAAATRPDYAYLKTGLNIGNGGFTASSAAVLGASGAAITIGDKNLLFSTDGGGNIGAAADNRPALVYASSGFNAPAGDAYAITATANFSQGDKNTGLGATTNILTAVDNELALISTNTGRDVADGIVAATVFDRNAASITNAATVRLHSFGWTNNSDTYTEVGSVRASGDAWFTGSVVAGVFAKENSFVLASEDRALGLGTTTTFRNILDQELTLLGENASRDVADGIVVASVFNRNAASITNASTVRIHSFGWTNNSDVYTELASIRGDGTLVLSGTGSATVEGTQADGASAIGVVLNTSTTYSTAGSKLLSIQNNDTEEIHVSYDGNLMWNADGGGDIGGSADNRPANIYASTSIFAATSFNVASGGAIASDANISSGLGTTSNFYTSDDQELLITNTGRTMGAGNISVALGGDLNSASPTATHKLVSIGYTDNVDAWQEQWAVQADGSLVSSSTGSATVTGAIADGAAAIVHTLDSTNTMSTAGSKLLSVQNAASEVFYIDKDGDCVSDTEMAAANFMRAGASGSYIYLDASTGGVGVTGRELVTENVAHTMQLRSLRTQGAGNRSIALDADVNNASIDEDHIIAGFGWINNADSRTESIAIKPNSVIRFVSSWAVAGAPTGQEGDLAYVSNGDAGSKCLALFDGTNWLRVVLGSAISAT